MWRLSSRKAIRAIMKPEGSVQEPGALGKGRSWGGGRAESGRALWAMSQPKITQKEKPCRRVL